MICLNQADRCCHGLAAGFGLGPLLFGLSQGLHRGGIDRGQLGKALLALFRLELEPLELLLML